MMSAAGCGAILRCPMSDEKRWRLFHTLSLLLGLLPPSHAKQRAHYSCLFDLRAEYLF